MHTNRSDGIVCPEEVVARAVASGLDVVALTDHDLTVDVAPGVHRDGSHAVHVLAGAELSGVHEGQEHHLLVYFPGDAPDAFRDFCAERCRERAVRYERSVEAIGLPGVEAPDAAACDGRRALTRHHLARALVDAGHASDVREAFQRFADDAHGHVPRVSLPFVDAIRIAREAGGVTSWAHPPLPALRRHLPAFVEAGLQGIEGLRPLLPARDRREIRALAKQHGLYVTGGSDWHGWAGDTLGLFTVERHDLDGFLAALQAAA
ncbi:MAG: phosphatase [Alphaproteobacteria bacterium]|nr:phosphatase [Alphaproteobacteria bacterium]